MSYCKSRIKGNLLLQLVPQGQPFLFEFWNNLISHLKRSLPNSISIEFRQRSFHLFHQIDPNPQILVQYPGCTMTDRFVTKIRQAVYFFIASLIFISAHANAQFEINEIADGVYLHYGAHEQININNKGDISNIGFIIGQESVAVIDTGGSRKVGEKLYDEIRRITDLPVRYVILTHAHPDHIFGMKAFESEQSEIVGHKNLNNSLIQRGEFYRDRFANEGFSENDLELLPQTVFVDSTMNIDLGNRQIRLIAVDTSHTNNDLLVIDENTKTIWTGDLLFRQRVPVIDGDVIGWLRSMKMLTEHDVEQIVPGHGKVATNWQAALSDQQRYLQKLIAEVREVLANQGNIQKAVKSVGIDERDSWLLFDDHHGQNVSRVYTQLEWE